MFIELLQIQNVRNLTSFFIQPSPRLNLIAGPNASGKTSTLEAIYLLSRARSFRTPRASEAIQHDKPALLVTANLKFKNSRAATAGIEKGRGHTAMKFNNENIKKISIQARHFPVILMAPDAGNPILGTPRHRRHWLDWAMFHVEPGYLEDWRQYHRALRQRNKLLKGPQKPDQSFAGWELVMSEHAEKITRQRHKYIKNLQDAIDTIGETLLPFKPRLELKKGWRGNENLAQLLEKQRKDDLRIGHTSAGMHCSDIQFFADRHSLSSYCSRGQIKSFAILLHIAQAKTIELMTGEQPIYLFDDFTAEMDERTNKAVVDILDRQQAQVFLTSTGGRDDMPGLNGVKRFHVERGELVKVVE